MSMEMIFKMQSRDILNNKTASPYGSVITCWNVSQVTVMALAIYELSAFNESLNCWDVSNVTNMYTMFGFATAFNQNISSWNVSSVKNK
jgi:surface protein